MGSTDTPESLKGRVNAAFRRRLHRFWIPSLETLPYTRANPSVAIVRHALALDERRRMFRVARWDEPQTHAPNPFDSGGIPKKKCGPLSRINQ